MPQGSYMKILIRSRQLYNCFFDEGNLSGKANPLTSDHVLWARFENTNKFQRLCYWLFLLQSPGITRQDMLPSSIKQYSEYTILNLFNMDIQKNKLHETRKLRSMRTNQSWDSRVLRLLTDKLSCLTILRMINTPKCLQNCLQIALNHKTLP